MTATLTENVTPEPGTAFKRPLAALDAGNRTTQWIDPKGNVRTIPSFVKILETWEDAEPCENSVLVELFDKHGHSETRFIIGAEAQVLKGKPAFEFDKVELAKYLMFAALEPNIGQNTLIIESLRVALPDSRHKENVKRLGELANTYEFTRNGERVYSTIRNIQPVDETKPAYRYARASGLFKSPKSINGILDLGGGTAIARLYSPSGSVIRELDINVPGTFDLARRINAALMPTTGQSQELSLIMDAIASSSFTIGTSGINFGYCFEKCSDAWLEDIRAKLRITWGKHFNEVGEVLIIGGSAPLAIPIEKSTKGRFRVAPDSQEISIKGMML
ncbi:hypothetical protein QT972_04790 [Microcoleus sp. herbarium7]|uniref:ParM/StbA family protein n=1 Tax=Microcoleus sp. herbarium7 TaxID=3055435 RepID=UPI002FD2AAFA